MAISNTFLCCFFLPFAIEICLTSPPKPWLSAAVYYITTTLVEKTKSNSIQYEKIFTFFEFRNFRCSV